MTSFPRTVFAALESYSRVGGLQQFNRRVVTALADLSGQAGGPAPIVVLRGDRAEDVAGRSEHAVFCPCGPVRGLFLHQVLAAAWRADILFLGHVNLLPVAAMAKAINPRLKIALFVHGDDVWNDPVYRKMRPWEPFLTRFVTLIGAVSAFTAERMARAYRVPQEKFTLFLNAVDPLPQPPAPAAAIRAPLLLTVARLSDHDRGKHHDSVLRALPTVLAAIPETRYRVIGDGVLRPQLETLAQELGVAAAVEFTGSVSDDDLARAYEEAAIFVMPSEKEGFGIVFLEAWQRGLPVICGTEDASHEVVSDGIDGYAIHHNDIAGLAARIIGLLTDPERAAAMGEAGRQKVERQYLMANFTTNLEHLLKELGG